ncbi:thioesterase family protein [Variovorax sp. J22P168]|uniref:acyl-CoA thioesterase n=1 Tax=Variovorax jilinensis TaxID=3053513 RepID=UPI002574DE43|nr:thioesterase family protein [Variovorax sp. J22P168]MDM0015288.1 thioesterase family protein [Variovorax sp. J22P168]
MSAWRSRPLPVEAGWIDSYGHMNAGRYFQLFIDEGYALMEKLGLGASYTKQHGAGIFVVDAHIRFLRELTLGARVHVRLRVLEVDRLRLLVLMELVDEDRDLTVATLEQLSVHADLGNRKARSFPDPLRQAIELVANVHSALALPVGHTRHLHCAGTASA